MIYFLNLYICDLSGDLNDKLNDLFSESIHMYSVTLLCRNRRYRSSETLMA